jgi:trehalose 2-sulfotransferase
LAGVDTLVRWDRMCGVSGRGYVLCAVPRTGSWLLCHALEQSGLAGTPAEYFWRGDMAYWRELWGVETFDDYVAAFQTTASANGVFGSKMMWGYFADFLDQAHAVSEWSGFTTDEVMQAVFPDVTYLWIRRRDKLRQAISWWRAQSTGEWAVNIGSARSAPPRELDLAAISRYVRVTTADELGWSSYFAERCVTPWTIDYEELVVDLDGALESALQYLGVPRAEGALHVQPRLERQADDLSERWVEEYLRAESSGRLEEIVARNDAPAEPPSGE